MSTSSHRPQPHRRRRRMIVAFVEVESSQGRFFRQAWDGETEVSSPPRTLLHREDNGEWAARYWCAADQPVSDSGFAVVPVYRTQTVPADARCEHCRIHIRELQQFLAPD